MWKIITAFTITSLLLLAACSGSDVKLEELPAGDASRGATIFAQSVKGAPTCTSCHSLDGASSTGPTLQDYSAVAPTRVDGLSAEEYTFTSMVRPAAHVVSGFGNVMYSQYGQRLSPQQIADLIAYLLTL